MLKDAQGADFQRSGILLGDGPGIGKGRQIAGIILSNFRQGRTRHLWFSVSADLSMDSKRDFYDIGGGNVTVKKITDFKVDNNLTSRTKGMQEGVMFSTYNALAQSAKGGKQSRFDQIVEWLCGGGSHAEYEGCIIFDESHKAKQVGKANGKGASKMSAAVIKLQAMLPMARIVYVSATGASELKQMGYMSRLGIWGPSAAFTSSHDFASELSQRGAGAMEMAALDLKARGLYISRMLSFRGTSFAITYVQEDPTFTKICKAGVTDEPARGGLFHRLFKTNR